VKTYAEKLKDPRWQKKRLHIMERAGFKCEQCGRTDKTLHVHHGWYPRGKEPWEAPDWVLWCLCEHCHDKLEAAVFTMGQIVGAVHPQDYLDLLGIVEQLATTLSVRRQELQKAQE